MFAISLNAPKTLAEVIYADIPYVHFNHQITEKQSLRSQALLV
ncbi:hypothetical protein FDUTEX481_09248 [Tolypothrix sp. PCC 7601]|nr:hypothetical protein [Tolypothrix sp. PCC 7601]EKF00041.1 hypothetical protein FDUTEX481_09248 [Tolypothrix sp. PCC 7601]